MLMNILHIRPPYLSEPLYLKKPKRVIIRVLFIHTADYFHYLKNEFQLLYCSFSCLLTVVQCFLLSA